MRGEESRTSVVGWVSSGRGGRDGGGESGVRERVIGRRERSETRKKLELGRNGGSPGLPLNLVRRSSHDTLRYTLPFPTR